MDHTIVAGLHRQEELRHSTANSCRRVLAQTCRQSWFAEKCGQGEGEDAFAHDDGYDNDEEGYDEEEEDEEEIDDEDI